MEFLAHLWLPILLSAAAVWLASAVAWMSLPHHRHDWKALPDEAGFYRALDALGIPPGNYGFPHVPDRARANDPEVKRRWDAGQIGLLSIWGRTRMGRNMFATFLVFLAVSLLMAYTGWTALAGGVGGPGQAGPSFGRVWRVMGAMGVLAYSFAFIPNGIWFGQYRRAIAMNVLDGVAYGLIAGAIFAGLWPRG
jgi:hypothetical protein